MSDQPSPIVLAAGEGHARLWGLGSTMTAKLTGAETGGAVGLTQMRAVAGERAPRHIHTREDEIFIIVGGEVTVSAAEHTQLLGPGGVAFLPRGIPHAYQVHDGGAEVLIMTVPGGFERFFITAGFPASESDGAPVGKNWSVDRTIQIAEQLDLGITWLK